MSLYILSSIKKVGIHVMNLTNDQKNIAQATFAQIPDTDQFVIQFYARLFEIDPSTKPLFKDNMAEQREKLFQALAVVVNGLDNLPVIIPAIQNLGKRHVNYGVTLEHWDSVGAALLLTIEDIFGDTFTEDVRIAWALAYNMIAETAMSAAYPQLERQ
jgi:hemoglobin-like flavoprotein